MLRLRGKRLPAMALKRDGQKPSSGRASRFGESWSTPGSAPRRSTSKYPFLPSNRSEWVSNDCHPLTSANKEMEGVSPVRIRCRLTSLRNPGTGSGPTETGMHYLLLILPAPPSYPHFSLTFPILQLLECSWPVTVSCGISIFTSRETQWRLHLILTPL
jgi:hypothetical protein